MRPTENPSVTSRIADRDGYADLVLHLKVCRQALLLKLDCGASFFKLLLECLGVCLRCSFLNC